MRKLALYAGKLGIVICLENMPFPNFSLATPEEIANVVYAVNLESFKMCLDTGHAAIFPDWQPHTAIRKYSDIIRTLHIHDNMGKNDDHLIPFSRRCVIDWREFSLSLKETGFDGVFNFECEPSHRLPREAYLAALKAHAVLARCIIKLADEEN